MIYELQLNALGRSKGFPFWMAILGVDDLFILIHILWFPERKGKFLRIDLGVDSSVISVGVASQSCLGFNADAKICV